VATLETDPHAAAGMLYETMRSQAQTINYIQYQKTDVPVMCLREGPVGIFNLRRGVLLVAGSGGAVAAAAGLWGRPDIVHCVRGGPSRPPAGCGNVQDSDDDEARGQRGDRWGARGPPQRLQ
jgi:hypothetical protein